MQMILNPREPPTTSGIGLKRVEGCRYLGLEEIIIDSLIIFT